MCIEFGISHENVLLRRTAVSALVCYALYAFIVGGNFLDTNTGEIETANWILKPHILMNRTVFGWGWFSCDWFTMN